MFLRSKFFNIYLLPGFIFQSVIMAGGYGTGRELVEFFLNLGPISSLLGLIVAGAIWAFICAISFEFARCFKAYDYRTFFHHLLGKAWISYELSYIAVVLIVLSVIAASSGNIIMMTLDLPYNVGVIGLVIYVCFMVFKGSRMIELILSFWSVLLYLVYFIFLTLCLIQYGPTVKNTLQTATNESGWFINGIRYAGYNLGLIPAVFFALTHIQTRQQAIKSGIIAGILGIFPAIIFTIAMFGLYPGVLKEEIPSTFILQQIGSTPLTLLFHVVLFGTLIETGTGLIHALNERAQSYWTNRSLRMPQKMRPLIALVCLSLAACIAQFGLTPLIAQGYGTLTWIIIAVYVIPIASIGIYKLKLFSNYA